MSHAYPTITADTPQAVDRWHKAQMARVQVLPGAQVAADTGMICCRLMPIFPTRDAGGEQWWPVPIEVMTLEDALKCLKESGLMYDRSRKSKVGYQRGLAIGFF